MSHPETNKQRRILSTVKKRSRLRLNVDYDSTTLPLAWDMLPYCEVVFLDPYNGCTVWIDSDIQNKNLCSMTLLSASIVRHTYFRECNAPPEGRRAVRKCEKLLLNWNGLTAIKQQVQFFFLVCWTWWWRVSLAYIYIYIYLLLIILRPSSALIWIWNIPVQWTRT